MSTSTEEIKQTAGKIARRIMWIALAGLLIVATGYYFYRTYTLSDGSRVGTLYKISRKGVVFKTYEGQLQLGNAAIMNSQSIWEFSAQDNTVYQQLQQLDGKSVKCYYKQLVKPFPWQGETDYLVYKVEPSN